MRQRGDILMYLILAIVAMGMLYGLYALVDSNWETSAGVKKGEKAKQAEWDKAVADEQAKEQAQGNTASAGLETDRAKDRVVVRTITQRVDVEVEKPVYRDVCLTPVGVCLANAAIRGADPDTCKPDGAVPGLRRPAGWNGRVGLALDYGDRGVLQGLPAKAQPPG